MSLAAPNTGTHGHQVDLVGESAAQVVTAGRDMWYLEQQAAR